LYPETKNLSLEEVSSVFDDLVVKVERKKDEDVAELGEEKV